MFTIPCSGDRYNAHRDVECWARLIIEADPGNPGDRPWQWRYRNSSAEIRTKVELDVSGMMGRIVDFELDAVPERKNPRHRLYLTSDQDRRQWLRERFLKHGLILGVVTFQDDNVLITKDTKSFRKFAMRCSGKAMVHNTEKLAYALANGIGDCKAYGYGMLIIKGEC